MFHTLNTPTAYEVAIKDFFAFYRTTILALHSKQWKQESIKDKSCIQYTIQQFYLALYVVLLIKYEVDKGVNTDWQYYIDKYNLADKAKKFACNGISLKKILAIFGLPTAVSTEDVTNIEGGISFVGINITFEVGGSTTESNTVVDINTLLSLSDNCVNFINNETSVFDMTTTITGSSSSGGTTSAKIYYGADVSSIINEATILTFSSITVSTLVNTVSINDVGYKYIIIPVILGTPSDFVDADTDFSIVMDSPLAITVDGVPCYLYRSYYSLGGSININIEA